MTAVGPQPSGVVGPIWTFDSPYDWMGVNPSVDGTFRTFWIRPFNLVFPKCSERIWDEVSDYRHHPDALSLASATRCENSTPIFWLQNNGIRINAKTTRDCCLYKSNKEIRKYIDLRCKHFDEEQFWEVEVRIACIVFRRQKLNAYVRRMHPEIYSRHIAGGTNFIIRVFLRTELLRPCIWQHLLWELREEIVGEHVKQNILIALMENYPINTVAPFFIFLISHNFGNTLGFSPLAYAINKSHFNYASILMNSQNTSFLLSYDQYGDFPDSRDENYFVNGRSITAAGLALNCDRGSFFKRLVK